MTIKKIIEFFFLP